MLTRQERKQISFIVKKSLSLSGQMDGEEIEEILDLFTEQQMDWKMGYEDKIFNPATGLWTTLTAGGHPV